MLNYNKYNHPVHNLCLFGYFYGGKIIKIRQLKLGLADLQKLRCSKAMPSQYDFLGIGYIKDNITAT
jgi:hypothetical protein